MVVALVYDGASWQIQNFEGFTSATTNNNTYIIEIPYGTDSGSVNALVASFSSSITLSAGLTVEVKVGNTNTGPSTLNCNSTGIVNIVDRSGNALVAGALVVGQVAFLLYDGTNFQLISDYSTTAVPQFVNVSGTAVKNAKTASWTAEQVVAVTGYGGAPYFGNGLSLSFNGANVGANGMDTGGMPTSGDISIYAIYNPSTKTWATLGTVGGTSKGSAYTGSNMPSGYTASCLLFVGCCATLGFYAAYTQENHIVYGGTQLFLNSGSATSYTSVSLAGIPAAAKSHSGMMYINAPESETVWIAGSNNTGGNIPLGQQACGATYLNSGNWDNYADVPLLTASTAYYYCASSEANATLYWCSFKF